MISRRFAIPLALAVAVCGAGYFWSSTSGPRPDFENQSLADDPLDGGQGKRGEEGESATHDGREATGKAEHVGGERRRAVIPREPTIRDKVVQLDVQVDDLIPLARDKSVSEENAKILRDGLWRNLRKLQEWARDEERRLAAIQSEDSEGRQQAWNLAKKWIADASQINDPGLRVQAIENIRLALQSEEYTKQLAALNALAKLHDVQFDKAGFRDLVLPFARGGRGEMVVSALYALSTIGRQPGDLDLVLSLIDSPSAEARYAVAHLAMVYSGGDLTGKTGAAVLRLLQTEDVGQLKRATNGMWGARVSPEIEKRILELASSPDRELRNHTIYCSLSTLKSKSPAVIGKLVEVLGSNNSDNSYRALWGLGFGVARENGHLVVDAMKTYFGTRSSSKSRLSALRLIGNYGSAHDAAWLQAVVDNPNARDPVRKVARRSLSQLKRR